MDCIKQVDYQLDKIKNIIINELIYRVKKELKILPEYDHFVTAMGICGFRDKNGEIDVTFELPDPIAELYDKYENAFNLTGLGIEIYRNKVKEL